ncbi:MAG: cytochrome c [Verrucomicrobia bacterium]|nr:cytochrome c [Verrucomicrobiota bacterium]
MRYFLLGFVLLVAIVASVAGKRGDLSRKPPIEIFDDMDRQQKLRPQEPNAFFGDGVSSRGYVPGTVARGAAYEDNVVNTGRVPGTTNFVENLPVTVTSELMARGQQRYQISCTPCHGAAGDGNGITKKIGAMAVVANLHDPRIVKLADGELFSIISHGKGLMQGYAANVSINDRWAITAYVRALQRSHLATVDETPAELRAALKK